MDALTLLTNQLQDWLMRPQRGGHKRIHPYAVGLSSDIGLIREENQDRVIAVRFSDGADRPCLLVALADGMGGMQAGAECAAIALSSFTANVIERAQMGMHPWSWLDPACIEANESVYDLHHGAGGATIVALLIHPLNQPIWLSAGDSRIYAISSSKLIQLSTDDTLAGHLGKDPQHNEGFSHLLQYVGMGPGLEPNQNQTPPEEVDLFILTSDGAHKEECIPSFVKINKTANDAGTSSRRIVELSKWCGGEDNTTVAVINHREAIKALSKNEHRANVVEVWDPYGEVQFFINLELFTQRHPHQRRVEEAAKLIKSIEKPATPAAMSGTASPQRKKKTRSSTTKKKKTEKGPDITPELFIEFPEENGQ